MKISFEQLKKEVFDTFVKYGMNTVNAQKMSDIVVTSDARGVYSHGINFMPGYVNTYKEGKIKFNPDIKIVKEYPSAIIIDGDYGIGGLVMSKAVELAMEKAKQTGCCSVSVINTGVFGAGGYYVNEIAKNGMVGFCYANAVKAATPFGGCQPYLGTNPYSFAAPAGKFEYVTLDMATTECAANKIMIAAKKNEPVRLGLGVDRNGLPTTDAAEIMNFGALNHFGGPKGYGLAFMINCMTGVLSNSAYRAEDVDIMGQFHDHPTISFYLNVIDISKFNDVKQFNNDMETMIEEIKNIRKADGVKEIFYPGEIELNNYNKAKKDGINIDDDIYNRFKSL